MTYECSGCGMRSCDGRCFDETEADYAVEERRETTTILGVRYDGRPRIGSVAYDIHMSEQRMGFAAAERHLRAKNAIRKVHGFKPHDLQQDMTDCPRTGARIFGRRPS